MRFLSLLRWLPFLFLGSCAYLGLGPKGLNLSTPEQGRMERLLLDREYVLASTVAGTDFFGQTDRYFVDARPFETLHFSRHTGDPAPLRLVTRMTLPAGTPVVLKEILYPQNSIEGALDEARDPHELAPTAHTWLVAEHNSPDGIRSTLVFVLPKDIPDARTFEDEVRSRLVSPMWVSTWLYHRAPPILDAIYQKNVIEGMSRAEVKAALGTPTNSQHMEVDQMTFEADYGDLQILFEGGLVSRVRSLKVEAEVARIKAEEKARQARIKAQEQRRVEEELAATKALEEAEQEKARAEAERMHAEKLAQLEKQRLATLAQAQETRRLQVLDAAKAAPPQAATKPSPSSRPTPAAEVAAAIPQGPVDLDAEAATPAAAPAPVPTARPFVLGAVVHPLTKEKARELGLRYAKGALVTHIRARGVALRIGLRNDDVILKLNRKRIAKLDDLARVVKTLNAESKVTLTVWRGGKSIPLPQIQN